MRNTALIFISLLLFSTFSYAENEKSFDHHWSNLKLKSENIDEINRIITYFTLCKKGSDPLTFIHNQSLNGTKTDSKDIEINCSTIQWGKIGVVISKENLTKGANAYANFVFNSKDQNNKNIVIFIPFSGEFRKFEDKIFFVNTFHKIAIEFLSYEPITKKKHNVVLFSNGTPLGTGSINYSFKDVPFID